MLAAVWLWRAHGRRRPVVRMMTLVSVSTDSRTRIDVPPGLPGSPAASRRRRTPWKDPRLFVGVALVAASALLGAALLGGGDSGVGVWATRTALTEGQALAAGDLVRREVGFAAQRDADRYLTADKPLPEGATVTRDVGAGELLPRSALRTGTSEPLIQVPLSVAPTAVPVTVRVGSVVDVWVVPDVTASAPRESDAGPTARRVLPDVTVLHLSRAAGPLGAGAERQVIVGLGPDLEAALPAALGSMATGSVVLTSTR